MYLFDCSYGILFVLWYVEKQSASLFSYHMVSLYDISNRWKKCQNFIKVTHIMGSIMKYDVHWKSTKTTVPLSKLNRSLLVVVETVKPNLHQWNGVISVTLQEPCWPVSCRRNTFSISTRIPGDQSEQLFVEMLQLQLEISLWTS